MESADETQVTVSEDPDGILGETLVALLSDLGERRLEQLLAGAQSELRLSPRLRAVRVGGARSPIRWNIARDAGGASIVLAASELERLFEHAYELRRMTRLERFPLGCTLANGRFQLVELLRGGPDRGMYRASDRESGRAALVTLGPAQTVAVAALEQKLRCDCAGVARLHFIGPLEAAGEARYDGLVEELPAGRPATEALASADRLRAGRIWLALARMVEAAHARGAAFGGLRPELIYVTPDDAIGGIASRCEPFLATAEARTYGVPPCFESFYLAPEVLACPRAPATSAADVFSLTAILAHWWTGAHPFEGEGGTQAISIAIGRRRPWHGPERLETIFEDGLAADVEARADLCDLIARLEPALREEASR